MDLRPQNISIYGNEKKQEAARVAWCFTYNNYTDEGENRLKDWLTANCKYAIYGHEIAPSTGTPHLQGYFSLLKKRRLAALLKIFDSMGIKPHLEIANGTPRQNQVYCRKTDTTDTFEIGNIESAGQGSRTDLAIISEKIVKDKVSLKRIAEEHPEQYVRYNKGFKALYNQTVLPTVLSTPKTLNVIWNYGQSGSGKSSSVFVNSGHGDVFEVPYPTGGKKWYHNYNGQKILMLDDVIKTYRYKELLRLTEPRVLQLETKGDFEAGVYDTVVINDTSPPWEVYARSYDYQLARRINSLYKWEGVYPNSKSTLICHKDDVGGFATSEDWVPDLNIEPTE